MEAVMECRCDLQHLLNGREAEQYAKKFLEYVADRQGWLQLWRCRGCGSYWEMSWEGGGGFDDGVMTLRWLSLAEVEAKWPELHNNPGH